MTATVEFVNRIGWTARDGVALTRRELTYLRRHPGELVAAVAMPAVMILVFGYIFGSAISVPGGNYREYLMPGLFGMTAVSGVMVSATLVSTDVDTGVMERFRSMPMARAAVPLGRTAADLLTCVPNLVITVGLGLAAGWRPRHGVPSALIAFGLILLGRYALSWAGTLLGLMVSARTADAMVPMIFPVTMLSNSFVPTSGLPTPLRVISEWNPVSALVASCRRLFGAPGLATTRPGWPLAHPYAMTVGWSLLLLAIFVPLCVWRFNRAGR
jgi:ABC-2 type transport system permease protein